MRAVTTLRPRPVTRRSAAVPGRGLRASLCLALLAAFAASKGLRAGDEAEQGTSCAVPAFLDDDDATLLAAYDGLRRGFEEAHLPRVCRRRRDGNDDAAWARAALDVSGGGAPLVVAFGRALCDRVAALPFLRPDGRGRIPCVYVETTATTRLGALADRADPAPPCAVVRAESSIEAIAGVLRRLFPRRERPRVGLAWAADAARPWRDALEAAGARTQRRGRAVVRVRRRDPRRADRPGRAAARVRCRARAGARARRPPRLPRPRSLRQGRQRRDLSGRRPRRARGGRGGPAAARRRGRRPGAAPLGAHASRCSSISTPSTRRRSRSRSS